MSLADEIADELRPLLLKRLAAYDFAQKANGKRPGPWGRLEQELVQHYLPLIQKGLQSLIATIPALVQRWFAEQGRHPQAPPAKDTGANNFVRSLQLDSRELGDALRGAWSEAYLAGGKDAHDQAEKPTGGVARAVRTVDWQNWTPGERRASALVGTGFETMLADAEVSIQGITDSVRNDIRDVLEEALRKGWSWQQAAQEIEKIVTDPFRAKRIAVTEINRAMSAASHKTFEQNDWGWDLVTAADPCPICVAVKEGNPHPVGDHHIPPYHPFCRCSLAPHIEIGEQ